jgi:YVTN family beta-propeller protein
MYRNNSNGSRAALARGFMALFAGLAMGLGAMASPAEAQPFAYVANADPISNNVSVIDTATNTVATTVAVGTAPLGVAVTPDGKHVYVANQGSSSVSVIETTGNTVMATVAVGIAPIGVAVTPDGKL